jgi:hypothetical protein
METGLMYAKFIGISAETAATIERARIHPEESEDQILARVLGTKAPTTKSPPPVRRRFKLGFGAWLDEGEQLFFFRSKESYDKGKAEAVAAIIDSAFVLYGAEIQPSRGSYLQPAMQLVQRKLRDFNEQGKLISLDAWKYWHVVRQGKFVPVSTLRDPNLVVRRKRIKYVDLDLSVLDEL